MSLQGGNDPQKRQEMLALTAFLHELAARPRTDWDTLPQEVLMQVRTNLVAALPVVLDLCDVRIKQSMSRANYAALRVRKDVLK